MPATTRVFDLPDRLAYKDEPPLIADDERHFDAISANLAGSRVDLSQRLAAERRAPASPGSEAVERDAEIRRLGTRLRALSRYGVDLCLGRMVLANNGETVYIGRFGVTDPTGQRLLIDWRSPAAEPFFGATHAHAMGLASRRRYRWTRGRISDYWDEAFTQEALGGQLALDDDSTFLAGLGASRSTRMRDVLATIQADQDAIIRAASPGPLVIDGGPGTGKTVVALHRSAYLLYADARVREGRLLFVGPHRAYLNYVEDVLPSLGEEGVQSCTLLGLVPEGADATVEGDPEVVRLKVSPQLEAAIEAAVRSYERAPTSPQLVETPWADVTLDARDWASAFDAAEPGIPHNEARDQVWEELLAVLGQRVAEEIAGGARSGARNEQGSDEEEADQENDDDPGWGGEEDRVIPAAQIRRALLLDRGLRAAFTRAWPLLDPVGVVADLWSASAFLARSAPGLTPAEVAGLQRRDARAWTVSDLPLLDAARHRIGDPDAALRRRRHEAEVAVERERIQRVVDDILAAEDDFEGEVQMLRQQTVRDAMIDEAALTTSDSEQLAGPFAHVVVDEAQELTDAEWGMLLRRCPSRSFTIVGDRAQARHGFAETWQSRLARVGLDHVRVSSLTVNYRTPAEIMAEAEGVIRAALPDANVPTSIRSTGIPVEHGSVAQLRPIVNSWLAENAEGIACVIGDPSFPPTDRVASLTPELAKGLEFDLVVLVEPDDWGGGIEGVVDRYVAMTRATQRLVILGSS